MYLNKIINLRMRRALAILLETQVGNNNFQQRVKLLLLIDPDAQVRAGFHFRVA